MNAAREGAIYKRRIRNVRRHYRVELKRALLAGPFGPAWGAYKMPSTAEFEDFAYVESDPFVVPERLAFAHSLTQTPPGDPLGFVAIEVACADRLERICDERAKVRARQALRYAIRVGKIKRGCCEVCAAENAEAHHEDYSKPLAVRWFCRTHHNDIHRQEVVA